MAKKKNPPAKKKVPAKAKADPKLKCSFTKMIPIDQIKPWPENPNRHSQEQIQRFSEILKYQGTRRPFRISKRSDLLTVGHGQLEAYKLNGWTMCPVDYQDYEDEAQEFADVVADNNLGAWAQMDLESVSAQVQKIGKDFNLNYLGIDGFTLDPNEIIFPDQRGHNELTKDERTTEYMAAQSRNIILVYSLLEFNRVTELLAEIMKAKSFETFSDAVKTILEEYASNLRKKTVNQRKAAISSAAERN